MERESYDFIHIYNWEDDKICLQYSKKYETWKICHLGEDEVRHLLYMQLYTAIYSCKVNLTNKEICYTCHSQ